MSLALAPDGRRHGLISALPDFSAPRSEDAMAEALARAREEGRAEAAVEALRERAQLVESFEARLALARREATGEAAARLAAQLAAAVAAMQREIETELVRVLAPFLDDAMRTKALSAFDAAVRQALDSGQAVEVSGPADMLDALTAALGPLASAATFRPDGAGEVSLKAGRTRIATELDAFARTLRAIAGDAGGSP